MAILTISRQSLENVNNVMLINISNTLIYYISLLPSSLFSIPKILSSAPLIRFFTLSIVILNY